MKVVKKSDARSERIVKAADQVVIVHHMTAHDSLDEGTGFQHETRLDFSKCTPEQILSLAADAAIIAARQRYGFKTVKPESIPTEVDVAAMVSTTRSKASTVDKTLAKLAKATGANVKDLKKMLADLT